MCEFNAHINRSKLYIIEKLLQEAGYSHIYKLLAEVWMAPFFILFLIDKDMLILAQDRSEMQHKINVVILRVQHSTLE